MYAVRNTVTITDPSAAQADLEQVVAQTAGLPGYVAGYWMASSESEGVALIVFDSESAAQSFADFLKSVTDSPGVTMNQDSVEVWRVLAHI